MGAGVGGGADPTDGPGAADSAAAGVAAGSEALGADSSDLGALADAGPANRGPASVGALGPADEEAGAEEGPGLAWLAAASAAVAGRASRKVAVSATGIRHKGRSVRPQRISRLRLSEVIRTRSLALASRCRRSVTARRRECHPPAAGEPSPADWHAPS